MKYKVNIGNVVKKDVSEYKSLYFVSVDVDGVPSGILVGKSETDIGVNVLSGGEILKFLDAEVDFYKKIRDAILICDGE